MSFALQKAAKKKVGKKIGIVLVTTCNNCFASLEYDSHNDTTTLEPGNETMTTATATKFFAVVTFGTGPRQTVFTSLDRAKQVAASAIGTGSCSAARVYECDSRKLAKTADISTVRDGERIV